jgi:glycosyltransferase involved in cell wall biosynthesis
MKTLFLSFFPAYPPDSGAAAVTYNCARHMPGRTWLVQMAREPGRQPLGEGLELITLPWADARLAKLANLPRRIRAMINLCREIEPDLIVLEGASWAMYHWLLLRALRRANQRAEIVHHAHNVEYHLRRQKHGRLVTALTHWAEGRLIRDADRAFACSPVDQDEFERLYGSRPGLLPNGVDVERFDQVAPDEIERVKAQHQLTGELVLFMGMYSYPPNREAIDFLVQQVMPRLIERRPDARLVILGGETPYARPWLIQPGRVPHETLPAVIQPCNVGAAPIFSGSGTRLKILEYLAAGLPAVATAKGAEGLALEAGRDLLLAEDAERVAVAELLGNRERAKAFANAGAQKVREQYSWPAVIQSLAPADEQVVEVI